MCEVSALAAEKHNHPKGNCTLNLAHKASHTCPKERFFLTPINTGLDPENDISHISWNILNNIEMLFQYLHLWFYLEQLYMFSHHIQKFGFKILILILANFLFSTIYCSNEFQRLIAFIWDKKRNLKLPVPVLKVQNHYSLNN